MRCEGTGDCREVRITYDSYLEYFETLKCIAIN